MRDNKSISVIIPTLNEEKNLPIVLASLPKYIDEVLIIDGYSVDGTVEIAKRHNAKVIYSDKGKGAALIKGLNMAKGDIIIMMDADCSHRVNEFDLLIGGINAGYDLCMGSRFIQGGGTEDMPWYRVFGNKFFVFLVNIIWRMNYSDLCYGYRSLTREAAKRLELKSESFAIETEMSIKAAKKKLKVIEVPSFEKKRKFGHGNLKTFKHGFRILMRIAKEL
ncbi:MAG: glycosyltransferase family 2 protein [Nanoarchaeota archaeon]|nr:glycosyltransferase family 2 protein [Nanoarchaeota archaeon]